MDTIDTSYDTIIVGAGLAGLTAAAYLSRARKRVLVLERAGDVGGRARTELEHGFSMNLGAHALYRGGAAESVLRELGVSFEGRPPPIAGGYAIQHGKLHTLPSGAFSLLTTDLLPLAGKLEIARLLGTLKREANRASPATDLATWTAAAVRDPCARLFLQALMRLTTYGSHPASTSAHAALRQMVLGLTNSVSYIDEGWGVLVRGLTAAAIGAGARIVTGMRVSKVQNGAVTLEDGKTIRASSVILAVPPRAAADMVDGAFAARLSDFAAKATPALAACLDVALERLPRPRARVAIGIDRPTYASVHSSTAKLAPEGCALIHCIKYLDPFETQDAKADEHELEGALELLQPGWQSAIVKRRFLPRMTVMNALIPPKRDGLPHRPGVVVPELDGVFLAGDWIGDAWMLADASFASAKEAATRALECAAKEGARAA